VQQAPIASVSFVSANAGGDVIPAGIHNAGFELDGVALLVKNASAGSLNVTVQGVVTAVPAGAAPAVIPVNRGVYPGTQTPITYSGVTSLTVAAVRI
jgi:hypothetical protein